MEHTVEYGAPILAKNDSLAAKLRSYYQQQGVYVINLLSSPGAGKTTTILAMLRELAGRYRIGVIEGDIASDVDAVKVKEAGAAAVQINTGGLCHLESAIVVSKVDTLSAFDFDLDGFTQTISQINPQAKVFPLSGKTGEGVKDWCDYIARGIEELKAGTAQN